MKRKPLTRLYKGREPGSRQRIKTGVARWDSYFFAASDYKSARAYGSCVDEVHIAPDAKILYEGTRAFPRGRGWRRGMTMLDWADAVATKAAVDGYDAVHFERQSDIGTAILNPRIILRVVSCKRRGTPWP